MWTQETLLYCHLYYSVVEVSEDAQAESRCRCEMRSCCDCLMLSLA